MIIKCENVDCNGASEAVLEGSRRKHYVHKGPFKEVMSVNDRWFLECDKCGQWNRHQGALGAS